MPNKRQIQRGFGQIMTVFFLREGSLIQKKPSESFRWLFLYAFRPQKGGDFSPPPCQNRNSTRPKTFFVSFVSIPVVFKSFPSKYFAEATMFLNGA